MAASSPALPLSTVACHALRSPVAEDRSVRGARVPTARLTVGRFPPVRCRADADEDRDGCSACSAGGLLSDMRRRVI